jgi:MFS family permease
LRDYRLLLSAFVVSTAGDWLYKLALPLLVLSLTGSALQTAVVYSLEYVPYLLFAMAGGVISDRYDRRLLLIGADSAAAVLIGALAVLAWFNQYQLWSIYLAAFLLSTITPLYQASFLAILPSTVPPERLGWANSRMQAGQSALDLAGPLLGAGAVAALGARWALSLDSASFALSALAVALIVRAAAHRPERAPATVREDLRAAVRFVRDTPILLWGAIAAAGSSLGLSMIEANMLSYLVRYRHQSVAAVGVVFAALGAGALIGALLAPRIGKLANSGLVIIGSVLVGGVGTALLLVLHQLVTIAAAWVLVGASTAVFIVTFFTLRHQIVPQHLLGRVVVMTRLIAYVTVPIAPLIGGALLSATGSFAPVIVVSAVAQIGIAVVALCTPLRTASAPTPAA